MKTSNFIHTPVLLQSAVKLLNVARGSKYIDVTLGGGGHTEQILKSGGMVLGIDQDEDAIKYCGERFKDNKNLRIARGNFKDIKEIAQKTEFSPSRGILYDLGTSENQIKKSGRGFSFAKHEMLDMRMDSTTSLTAYEIVNNWGKNELVRIFEEYGEEEKADLIAEKIVDRRKKNEVRYSDELAGIIAEGQAFEGGIHPATRVFQALRIAVNDELGALEKSLKEGVEILEGDGRIVVISFHSLEDRIVKRLFLDLEKSGKGRVITKKPIKPDANEVAINRKARSAKMRAFEKI